jgi:membrane-associated protein
MSSLTNYLHIFLHLDAYITVLIQQLGAWTYGLLFLIIFCESGVILTPILPGESLLFAVGSLAARNAFNLTNLLITLIAAAILGGIVNFCLGYIIGNRLLSSTKRSFFQDYLERTHRFYEKHGAITIVLARFLPIIRTYAPFIAGLARMNPMKFMIYNIVGAFAWILLFIYGSYFFGNLPAVKNNFSLVILGIVVISLVPAVIEFIRARALNKKGF